MSAAITGVATVIVQVLLTLQFRVTVAVECPGLVVPSMNTSQTELLAYLTQLCHYDPTRKPANLDGVPTNVTTRIYVYYLSSLPKTHLEFRILMLLQLRWMDKRLAYEKFGTGYRELTGGRELMSDVWTPHLFLVNERETLVMGPASKDDLLLITPEGQVIFMARLKGRPWEKDEYVVFARGCMMISAECLIMWQDIPSLLQVAKFFILFMIMRISFAIIGERLKTRVLCYMKLGRYNESNVLLQWESQGESALITSGNPGLTEYTLVAMRTRVGQDVSQFHANASEHMTYSYSSLRLTFLLQREYGFYIMDYYVPSILLVILSWMTFWLEADSIPTRVLLGTSTMLTFILLGWSGNALPKASTFKANDAWFICCTGFIFLSLTEFAFVNTIHRSGNERVTLKKATSKYILRSTFSPTPQLRRRRRSSSCPSSPEIRKHFRSRLATLSPPALSSLDLATALSDLEKKRKEEKEEKIEQFTIIDPNPPHTSMTPQEIALWIDKKSRIVFPAAFFTFNAFYWSFLWIPSII